MKEMFPEYHYFPDFQQLWKSATFVFDTNVLLDVYRLSPETSSDLIKILMHLKRKNRMWIPYQFAREYYRNLPRIRREVGANYDRRMKELDKLTQVILNLLRVFDAQTDFELDEQIGNLEYTFRTIRTGLKAHRRKHRDRLESDDLERTVEKLFKGRIGSPCSDKRLAEIFEEGARRYALGRPPGFKDKHGDLIGWLQIVEFACEGKPKRPVILITRDSGGEDWFYRPRIDDKVYGPHPELVKEMRDQAGVELFIYQTGEFMALANENLSLDEPVPASSIEEHTKSKLMKTSEELEVLRIAFMKHKGLPTDVARELRLSNETLGKLVDELRVAHSVLAKIMRTWTGCVGSNQVLAWDSDMWKMRKGTEHEHICDYAISQ